MTLATLVGTVIGLINQIIPVLVALALVLFLWGGVLYIYKSQDAHGRAANKELLIWGLIAMFVLISIWGILRLLCNSFLGSASCQGTVPAAQEQQNPYPFDF